MPRRQLVRAGASKDGLGYRHFTYTQRYQGHPGLRLDAEGRTWTSEGNLTVGQRRPGPGPRPRRLAKTLGPRAATAQAVAVVRAEPPGRGRRCRLKGLEAASTRAAWSTATGSSRAWPSGRTELAYQVEVTNKKNIRDMVFVTAIGGKVVNRYSLVDDALYRILYEAKLKPNGTIQFKKVWEEGQQHATSSNADQLNIVDSTGEAYWFFRQRLRPRLLRRRRSRDDHDQQRPAHQLPQRQLERRRPPTTATASPPTTSSPTSGATPTPSTPPA